MARSGFASRVTIRWSWSATTLSVEGANTSFQLHLRVNPAEFTRAYNAAQLAIAPVLAVAGNSPTFLGHRLWEETRIALCKQSIDDRDTRGPRRRLARMAFGTGWLRDEADAAVCRKRAAAPATTTRPWRQ